jgi:hypothetical protein
MPGTDAWTDVDRAELVSGILSWAAVFAFAVIGI